MAMGVMRGNGTRGNPWIVEDGWDFNALRDLPANDVESVAFVELGADINLSMFPNFVPINDKFINFDGKGFKITDFYIEVSNARCGLFGTLTITEYLRNVVLEGEVVSINNGSTWTGGMLVGHLEIAIEGDELIENIEAYGSMHLTQAGNALTTWGGVIGYIALPAAPRISHTFVSNCSFVGTVNIDFRSTSTSQSSTAFGCITNFELGSRRRISISGCKSDVTAIIVGGLATTAANRNVIGGIIGRANDTTNVISDRVVNIVACIGRLRVNFMPIPNLTSRHMIFAGIVGHNNPMNNIPTSVHRCAAFLELLYDPVIVPNGPFHLSGIIGLGADFWGTARSVNVNSSYSVISCINSNNLDMPANFSVHGIGQNVVVGNSFFDTTVARSWWQGSISQEAHGRTTAQLQNRQFLESQGWVF